MFDVLHPSYLQHEVRFFSPKKWIQGKMNGTSQLARALSRAGFINVTHRATASVPIGGSFFLKKDVFTHSFCPSQIPRPCIWPGL
jgi:hypothetical protein